MRKILCRADGNSSIGLGHLYRMFALYEMYKEIYDVTFVTRKDSELKVIPKEYKIKLIPTTVPLSEEPSWFLEHFDTTTHIIIADGYSFIDDYQKQLRNIGFFVMYIDDLVTKKLYANVIVNHAPKLQRGDFNIDYNSVFALGTKYAILRPCFLEATINNRIINDIDSVFVCFGGADQYDLSFLTVSVLVDIYEIKNIHVVLGGAYKHDAIFNLANQYSHIKVYQNLGEKELIEVMQKSNFAIVPSSTILYELCCVKMPILSGYFVDNQKNIYDGFVQNELVYPGGDFSKCTEEDIRAKIKVILKTSNYNCFIANQSKLFDSKIKQRFFNLLLKVDFRTATLNDTRSIYDWANDDLVRQNSFNSDPIEFEAHNTWFSNKIEDQCELFLIGMVEDNDAGLIRFSIGDEYTVIGISLSKIYRGKNLASKLLIESTKIYFKTNVLPIFAYIKKENIASIQAFKNAGFRFLKSENIQGVESVTYQLKKNDFN